MSKHDHSTTAFTLVELLLVIGIIAMLISILLPALQKARQAAQTVACASRMQQIGVALIAYAAENQDVLPWAEFNYTPASAYGDINKVRQQQVVLPWDDMIHRHLGGSQTAAQLYLNQSPVPFNVLHCPADRYERRTNDATKPPPHVRSYAMVRAFGYDDKRKRTFRGVGGQLATGEVINWPRIQPYLCIKRSWVRNSSEQLMIVEAPKRYNVLGSWGAYVDRPLDQWGNELDFARVNGRTTHGTRWNYLFVDGHVAAMNWTDTVSPNATIRAIARDPTTARSASLWWLRFGTTGYDSGYLPPPQYSPGDAPIGAVDEDTGRGNNPEESPSGEGYPILITSPGSGG